jgi:hypothetical protein
MNEGLRREIAELASRATDGCLDAPGQVRLEEILRSSTEARAFYVRFMGISAGLAWAARGTDVAGEPTPTREHSFWRITWRQAWAAVAIVVVGVWGVWLSLQKPAPFVPPNRELGVATLSTAKDIEWEDAQEPRHKGNVLLPGWIRIKSGLAQIDFISGTSVWVEGPASFQIVSTRRGYLESGKLVAQVPHGTSEGFAVDCPLATIVDRGTGFGVDMESGCVAVHVFAGMVEVTPKDGTPASYFAGQAAVVDESRTVHLAFCDPRSFDYGGYGWGFNSFRLLGPWPVPGPIPYYGPGGPWYPAWGPQVWKGWDPLGSVQRQLGVSSERWGQIQPILSSYLGVQWELDSLGYVSPDSPYSRAAWDLWLGTQNPQATDDELQKRLAEYRTTREAMLQQRDQTEKDLKALLTVKEEAMLMDMGYLR